jgi:lipoate-protein ligase A
VEKISCRLLPFSGGDGPHNMAADETLLQSAAAGALSLRFYGWTQATLSLGYFQSAACRLADPRLAALPYVRRPTGGATLVHHHELTYALALPERVRRNARESWLLNVHGIIATALKRLGVECALTSPGTDPCPPETFLCFRRFTAGDVLCGNAKIVGSAQRRHRQGLLQHGAMLLAMSPSAPTLPGIEELCGRHLDVDELREVVVSELAATTGWRLTTGDWTDGEKTAIEELAVVKYRSGAWNDRR